MVNATAGTLLMLLVSNLLLSEKVASMPMNVSEAGRSEVSLKDLFDNATILSENITKLSTDMRMEFFYNNFSSRIFSKTLSSLHKKMRLNDVFDKCHTLPIKTPETKAEIRETSFEDFLNMTFRTLRAWEDPLKHLVTELSAMPGVPDVILSQAKAIEAQHKILLEYIMKIVSKVNPALQEKEDSLVWSDLDLLQAADEESRLFALYVFSYCLRVDLQIVEFCIYMLRCLHMHGKICYIESAPSF
ncbi:prolactin-7D1-like [Cricetulus griseus]|uniref:Prolactin-7D1-like n=2 Tax=Cricetulus griseus TaxID=10029 RepID=A0A9J7JL73_CRIGR|nr:prolactin-7D1-like [Cricetulus griseus]XP_027294038.2 prolactin-7D1-like [Cricetulus griseus]